MYGLRSALVPLTLRPYGPDLSPQNEMSITRTVSYRRRGYPHLMCMKDLIIDYITPEITF